MVQHKNCLTKIGRLSRMGLIFLAVNYRQYRAPQMIRRLLNFLFLCAFAVPGMLFAQEKSDTTKVRRDSTKVEQFIESIKKKKVPKRLLTSITRKSQSNPTGAVKSENAFIPYEGKIIRKIDIRHIGFDKTVYDTTRNIQTLVTRIGNALHTNSKEKLIKDNLFIAENKPLSPYKMADNERYLRDLDFILDAKFYVVRLPHTKDSVDVVVLTRDVFSIGGGLSPSPTKTKFKLFDTNLNGWGQRVQFNGLFQNSRNPSFGYEALYRKNSIGGSFINGTLGYTQLNTGSSYGDEEENAYYLKLDRPLVSPYTTFAGGVEISKNWSQNFYNTVDTIFRNYKYFVNDFWVGYNIGSEHSGVNRTRQFVALRMFDQRFSNQPLQTIERENTIYNNRSFVLGGVTFFKQNFYTASYIYGFGRTEDVPYGHRVSLYFGWSRQLALERPYIGLEAEKSIVSRKNEFYTIGFRLGGYQNNKLEDGILLLYGSLMSRLIPQNGLLIRQSFFMDYTNVYRQRTSLPLNINNEFGLRYFATDSLRGTKRFHIRTETLAFTPLSILGFRIAPFGFGEMAMLGDYRKSIFHDKPYFGFGGGVRTRNENLVFGTMEVRLIYFPRTVENIQSFAIKFSTNLRVKYSASFIKPPAPITYN
jgi:hypothetical protein